ncbi:MAG: spore coat associated protein CotJA [Ruminococcaceae bacterium]|nr:spore coat associated protein CotJA [Oscillospiraceae bacterium]
MDYRKDVRTPKDRVDDELLRRLLSETDELLGNCGCESGEGRTVRTRTNCTSGCRQRENGGARERRNTVTGCGCARERDRDNDGCGCARERDRDNDGCGCARGRDRDNDGCGCINRSSMSIQTQGLPLVMSYAPDHEFYELYEDEEALLAGTLFRPLNLPFYPTKCGKNCGCSDEK